MTTHVITSPCWYYGGTAQPGMHLFTMARASNKGCWSMAGSSSNGGSIRSLLPPKEVALFLFSPPAPLCKPQLYSLEMMIPTSFSTSHSHLGVIWSFRVLVDLIRNGPCSIDQGGCSVDRQGQWGSGRYLCCSLPLPSVRCWLDHILLCSTWSPLQTKVSHLCGCRTSMQPASNVARCPQKFQLWMGS